MGVRVLVATKPVDFRKGAEGLAALVRETMQADPFSGAVYVFRAKRADRVKLIYWDGTGVCLRGQEASASCRQQHGREPLAKSRIASIRPPSRAAISASRSRGARSGLKSAAGALENRDANRQKRVRRRLLRAFSHPNLGRPPAVDGLLTFLRAAARTAGGKSLPQLVLL